MAKSTAALTFSKPCTVASKLAILRPFAVSSNTDGSLGKQLLKEGLAPGSVAEIHGRRSSGRTALCLHVLAQATARGEVCAVVDLHNSFHPASAEAAGVAIRQLVWVQCAGNAQHALRATDLLLHAGGFGVVLMDLGEATPQMLQRIPISYWYRLRKAIEETPARLLACTDSSEIRCSFANKLAVKRKAEHWIGQAPFACLEAIEAAVYSSKALNISPELLRAAVA